MKRKLITYVSCKSGEELWCLDEQIYALCKIDVDNMQAECKISPMEILEEGISEVRKLISWGDKILLLPAQLDQRWGVYDKITGDLQYENFCKEGYQLGQAVLSGDRLIVVPIFATDPVAIISLNEKKIIARQYLQTPYFIPNKKMEIWQIREGYGKIRFLIRGTCFYGQIKEEEVELVRVHAPEPLECADFYENEVWAVNGCGNCLYHFDEEGNLLESIPIELKTEVTKMLAKSRYIFLLSVEDRIWIFDKNSRQIKQDCTEMEENVSILPPLSSEPAYWDYAESEHEIWFLPVLYPLQIMDADTLLCQQKVITYADSFSEEYSFFIIM